MENDFKGACNEDEVAIVLCEGCGPTNVDSEGSCVYDCEKHHAPGAK